MLELSAARLTELTRNFEECSQRVQLLELLIKQVAYDEEGLALMKYTLAEESAKATKLAAQTYAEGQIYQFLAQLEAEKRMSGKQH